jgi:general L-amino acid transport system substrate-binding protein
MKTALACLTVVLFAWTAPSASAQQTLQSVRKAGVVTCGVIADEDDYSEADTHGDLTALGADYCRSVSAEIFGDPSHARFLTLPDEPSARAKLRDGKIDVLFGVTPDPLIGAVYRLAYGPPLLIDGQGFLVSNRSGVKSLDDLSGKRVCFINAAPPEQTLYDALEPRLKAPELRFPYSERGEMEIALLDGHCDAITGDVSWMANVGASFNKRRTEFSILPNTISVDPFSPAYRTGDPQWAALIDWTVWTALQAEIHGIDHPSFVQMQQSKDPVVRRLLGETPWIAKALGLGDDAFAHALWFVGNAEEIYDRDVGKYSRLQLTRGKSAPIQKGGALWALPVEPLQ